MALAPSSAPLLPLLATTLALIQMQFVIGSSTTSSPVALLTGNWTAFPGKSLSPAPGSARLAPDGVQVTVHKDGVILRQNVTGLIPGSTYILSLRMTASAGASANLAIAVDATAVITAVVPGSRMRTGPFVATADNETLAVAFFTAGKTSRVYLDNVTISPANDNQTIDARHIGHVDYVVPPFNNVTHVAPQRCPLNTRTCYNAIGDQMTCCSSACGADNDPIATCHVANATVPKLAAGKVAVPAGATCPPGAPNPCYNFNGQSMACCAGGCGPNGGALATCAGDTDVTPAPTVSSPTGSPSPASGSPPPPTGSSSSTGTCPPQAPNPCYNLDGQNMACCPGTHSFSDHSLDRPAGHSLPNGFPGHAFSDFCPGHTFSDQSSGRSLPDGCPGHSFPNQFPDHSCPDPPPPSHPLARPVRRSPSSPTDPPTTPSPTKPPATPSPTTAPATPPPLTASAIPSGTNLPAAPSGYRWVVNPALTDEFNGDELDTSKWRATHPYWSGRLPSQFDPANVAVGGGVARLTSTTTVSSVDQVNDPYNDPWVSSAVISSNAAIAGYGYYECRFKASNMQMTSSFWFQSQRTEIDVIETVGVASNYRSRYMNINTHYYPDNISPSTPDFALPYNYRLPAGTLTSGDFHTYGVWWKDANTLLFYFDGQLAWQTTPPGPFSEQSYLFLDTEVFSSEGLPAVADLKDPDKNAFVVDYVRAFTLQSA
ncbi:Concanavalin A-like lectin/glucanase [Klebsormidium nitens]|uniref:Concanavalin A-like lectin/glucanase n=1 Tax=Klebsormidium nitens TaxID=105231 RepID=A0A1Y1I2G0_KLENI|nr:Concanavalin A-like lectin/glucanase [Klebsormidium nitens]|eukprot:GAQ83371.1 Concanavalin A-like lectin/glucanase [Klebsormidium nitens]